MMSLEPSISGSQAVSSIPTVEELIAPIAPLLSVADRALITRAYSTAREAHRGQKRKSGEEYFLHCAEVARILVDLRLDAATIAAGLLHDTAEDTKLTIDDIENLFGDEVANLVNGVTKMEKLPLTREDNGRPQAREAEYLRKTLLAMNDDVRVILIKLADRLHNMRTLGHLSPERQQRNARETMDIFAPLASRLGIWQIKWELEDLSFRYLQPDRFKHISSLVAEHKAERDAYVNATIERLKKLLAEHGIEAEVTGRSKHIYSIFRKMDRKGLPFDQIFDVRAVRVLVKDRPTCYYALGLVHEMWRPIAGEFDDYIAVPKDNFYQSLHTAVFLEDGRTLEIQIRTVEMHEDAEYGIAAHWRYKEGARRNSRDESYERRIRSLRELLDVGSATEEDAEEFVEAVTSDLDADRVYVFTPRGDIVDLPAGSTPIDFAYMIHTDIGHRCRGAKIGGKLVGLDYKLQVGDRIEILTSRRGGPSRDWLNPHMGYVRTKRAASKIRQWFRKQDRDKMIQQGREILERELKRLGEDRLSHEQVANLLGFEKTDDLLEQLGYGELHPQHIATRILEIERRQQEKEAENDLASKVQAPTVGPIQEGVTIQGTGGLLTNLARCCNPVLGDQIVGYVTRGRGVTVHRLDCPNVPGMARERLISVEWGGKKQDRYPVPVIIVAHDREGLMRDVGAAIAGEKVNVTDLRVKTEKNVATFQIVVEVESAAQLSSLLTKIERVPNVMEARRKAS